MYLGWPRTTFVSGMMVLLLLHLLGCSRHGGDQEPSQVRVYPGREYERLRIPSVLWDKIQSVYVPDAKQVQGQNVDTDQGEPSIATNFYPIHATLTEKTDGVLGGMGHRFEFPEGGGLLDLADIVDTEIKGTWYLKVEPIDLGESAAHLRVFYLSTGREREIDGRKFASGCRSIVEITSYFHQQMAQGGFRVNTTKMRYLSVLAGSYFFVTVKENTLFVSQLTLTDSRYPELMCNLEAERR